MTANQPYTSRYLEIETQTANPLQLVVKLYDGAIQYLQEAKLRIQESDIEGRTRAINRTLAIISELQVSLNFEEGGQIARSLESLYAYMKGRLISANLGHDDEPLSEVISLLATLKSAWHELATLGQKQASAAAATAPPAPDALRNSAVDTYQPGTVNLSC